MKAAAVMRDQSFHNAHGLCPPARRPPPPPPGDGCDCTVGNEAGARCSVVLCPLAQSVLTPTLQTCGQAVRPFTHDVPGRSSLSFRIFFIIIIIYFFTFFCVHLQSCAWLHISTVCLLVLVCVSACQGEQDLQLAPSEYSPTHPSLIIMQQPHWQMHIHTEGRGVFCHCQALITALWFAHTEWLRLLFF